MNRARILVAYGYQGTNLECVHMVKDVSSVIKIGGM